MQGLVELKGELLKQLQKTELQILSDVTQFCDQNGISYCLTSGTLLGAVRHKGFIPWDDDIDISMPRADFEKFLSMAKNLPDQYECVATRFNSDYPIGIVKVRKNGTVMKEPAMAHLNINHGVWIDIFPLDKVKNVEKLSKRAKKINILTTVINYKTASQKPKKLTTKMFCMVFSAFSVRTLDKWRTKIMTAEEKTDAKYLVNFVSNLGYKNLLFNEDVYFPFKKATFEGLEFSVPASPEKWLTSAYGDYMTPPPVDEQVNRHKILELKL